MLMQDLERKWLNGEADQIERALWGMSLPVKVHGGRVTTDSVRYHLVSRAGAEMDQVSEAARRIAEAVGVHEVQVSTDQEGLVVEVPHPRNRNVRLLSIMEALGPMEPLTAVVGMGVGGRPLILRLQDAFTWHLVVEGPPGIGKSELLRTLLVSLSLTSRPSQLQIIGVDLTGRELSVVEALPHALTRVLTGARGLGPMTTWLEEEVSRREAEGIRFPDLLLVVDELQAVMQHDEGRLGKLLRELMRIAQKTGFHLLAATECCSGAYQDMVAGYGGLVHVRQSPRSYESLAHTGFFEFLTARGSKQAKAAWLSADDLNAAVRLASAV